MVSEDMNKPSVEDPSKKRRYARAPFETKASVGPSPSGPWIEAQVMDISFGGAHVRFKNDETIVKGEQGEVCAVKFHAKGEDKVYVGKLAWVTKEETPDGVKMVEAGVNFGELPLEKKNEILKVFMWIKLEQNSQKEKSQENL